MRAILIDPVEKKIEAIDVKNPNGSLQEFYDIIGTDLVEMVYLDRNIVMVIDEYGRLKDIKGAFKFLGCDDLIIAGKAVVLGNKKDRFLPLQEYVRNFEMIVEWVKPEDVPEPEYKIMSF